MADPQGDSRQSQSPEYQLKSLGLYSNLSELKQLFLQLKSSLAENGLFNNKPLFVKLKGYSVPVRLVSEVQEIEQVPEDRWERSYFLIDVVSLLTGIARTLNQTGKTELLSEFTQTTEDDYLLREWFQEQHSGDLTKESFADLLEFAHRIESAFDEILENPELEAATETSQEQQTAQQQIIGNIADVAARINSGSSSASDENPEASGSEPAIDLNDTDVRIKFNNEANWIFAFSRQQLLVNYLESLNTSFESLPPDLQTQFLEMSSLLRSQIIELLENLPPEKLAALLNQVGNVTLRAEVFNLLIQSLLSDPRSQFFTQLNDFYKKYFLYLAKSNPQINIEEKIEAFTLLEIKEDTQNEVLQRIIANIQAWKQELLEQIKKEREAAQQIDQQQEPITETVEQKQHTASIVAKLPPAALTAIETDISRSNFSTENKDILRSQTPRLLWGTAAELFREQDGSLSAIDQVLFSQVSAQTLNYILSLESSELEALRTSPSTLIRHIKNLRDRILRDQNFVYAYEKFRANHDVPQISRANRVERETEWANSQLEFELFASHNITDETTPDDNGLQSVFNNLKHDLKERVFTYFDDLSEAALEQLYIKPAQRSLTMRQLHSYINEDLGFVDALGKFYNQLLAYYGNAKGVGIQQQLQRSLQKTVVTDGVHYRLTETTEINTQQLFSQTVLTTLNPNNQEVINQLTATGVSATLDSMILAHGLVETQRLISDINPKLLEMTFGLPLNTLKPENLGQFRELLLQFATTRNTQFAAVSGAEEARGIFGALDSTLGTLDYKNIIKANEGQFNKQISQISTVREVVQNNSSEVVAEAVSKTGTKEKKQTFFKYYQRSWESVPQLGQIAIYYYFQIDGAEKYWEQYNAKTMALTTSLPLPIQFIDFEDKNRDGKLLDALVTELEHHGKEFNPLLTSDFAEDATSVAEHYKKVEQLKSSLTLYYLQELDEIEREEIAVAQGFATAAMLMAELENEAGGVLANPEIAMALPTLTQVMGDEDYATPVAQGRQRQSLFKSIFQRNKQSDQVQPKTKANKAVKALQKAAGKKAAAAVTKKVTGELAKKVIGGVVAGATAGLVFVLSNKQLREYATAGLTWLVANTLYALSTVGGLLFGLAGGMAGWIFGGGIPGGLLGTIAGANFGAQLTPGLQWGDWMGFTPRQPPGPWFGNSPVDSSTVSMEAARATTTAATANQAAASAQAAQTAQAASASSQAAASQAATGSSITGSSTVGGVTATVAPALQGLWTYISGLSIGITAPLMALGLVILSTTYIIMIIAGAFVVPVPVRDTDWKSGVEGNKTQESEQFATITKVADITQIENNTPTDITYTITITPKGNYSILVTDVSDLFSGFGEGSTENLVSPISSGSFPGEAFNSPQEVSYTIKVGGGLVDTLVNNTLIVSFDAYDINGYVVGPNQNYRTSASVRVGDPKEGCWPTKGEIAQEPGGLFSHSNPKTGYYSDAYDISGDLGTPIYAPFSGKLCRNVDNNIDADIYKGELGYGRWVTLYAPVNGVTLELVFAHLNEAIIELGGGPTENGCMQVSAQQVIAYMGNTGASTNPHLHYELKNYKAIGMKLQELVPTRTSDIVTDCHQ